MHLFANEFWGCERCFVFVLTIGQICVVSDFYKSLKVVGVLSIYIGYLLVGNLGEKTYP